MDRKQHNPRQREQDRQKSEEQRRKQREQYEADFKWLMEQPQGRRFMWRMLDMCGVYRTSFDGSSRTYFNEGARNVGLQLIDNIHDLSPDAYLKMLKEHQEWQKKLR